MISKDCFGIDQCEGESISSVRFLLIMIGVPAVCSTGNHEKDCSSFDPYNCERVFLLMF